MRKISISMLLIFAFSNCGVSGTTKQTCESDAGMECNCDDQDVHTLAPETQPTVICGEGTHLEGDKCVASGSCFCDQSGDYICTGTSGACVDGICETTENVMECEFGCDQNGCLDVEDLLPHYCEPRYSQYGTFLGYNGCCGTGFPTATHVEPGMLIKAAEFSVVFYYASNEQRYVFPSNIELDSWYSPLDENNIPITPNDEICEQVYEIPVELLASIPLGGNVTLRPGAFITGIETISERYLVDHCATLRQAESFSVLDGIYGNTASAQTNLIWDAFWPNYTEGQPIASAADFDWLAAYNSEIEEEMGIIPGICSPCVENPIIEFAADTPSGTLILGAKTLVAKLEVTAVEEDVDLIGQMLYINAYVSSPDGDLETWTLEDSEGNTISTVTADISGMDNNEVYFMWDSSSPFIVPAYQTVYLFVYVETTELTTPGDSIQLWLTSICGEERYGGSLVKP